MLSQPIEKQNCVVCNKELSFATPCSDREKPEPGDVTLCSGCANIAIFDENLKLRQPTPNEEKEILKDQSIIDSVNAIILALEIRKLKFKHGYGNS